MTDSLTNIESENPVKEKKKRGRKPKPKPENVVPKEPKKRGRKPKLKMYSHQYFIAIEIPKSLIVINKTLKANT